MAASPPDDGDEWVDAVIAEDLLQKSDPVIQQYLAGRSALIAEEQKQRSDHSFRASLSPMARKAAAIVQRIRAEEQSSTWTPALEESLAVATPTVTVHPGMMFTLAKRTMEATRLWQIVRRLPKGALLHAHCDAMVDFDYLLPLVLDTPGMHMASPTSALATAAQRRDAGVDIRFKQQTNKPRGAPSSSSSIWDDENYVPGTFVPMAEAAETFTPGGRDGFLSWLRSRCVISQTDAVEQHHGVDEIWKKFMGCFEVIGSMIHYEPIWRAFLQRLMKMLVADGVYWVEVRFAWQIDYCREGSEEPELDYTHMFQVIEEEVAKFQATKEGESFWGLRMIWTSLRGLGTRPIIQNMSDCIATKLAFPHLVAGYDVVGPEDAGRPLVDLLPELFWFRKQCAVEGVNIPFFFHAGETLGDGDSTDNNLFDALLLGTRRIGHAFSLYKHPRLIQAVKDKRILVESCPISNEILRLTGSIMQHPLPALLARGVPCALCNDDPAILGQDSEGMTHDFWQALQGWENLGLAGLGSLAENSVRWAAFEDQDAEEWLRDIREASVGAGIKAERLRRWAVEWERYCLWIVTEYGDDGDGEDDGDSDGNNVK